MEFIAWVMAHIAPLKLQDKLAFMARSMAAEAVAALDQTMEALAEGRAHPLDLLDQLVRVDTVLHRAGRIAGLAVWALARETSGRPVAGSIDLDFRWSAAPASPAALAARAEAVLARLDGMEAEAQRLAARWVAERYRRHAVARHAVAAPWSAAAAPPDIEADAAQHAPPAFALPDWRETLTALWRAQSATGPP